MADLTRWKLRYIQKFIFIFRFFLIYLGLTVFRLRLNLDLVHFLLKGFHLIIKDNLLSFVIEVFIDLFDEDFDGFVCSLLHDFEIILICQGNLIIFLINIIKLEFGRELFKNILDIGYKSCIGGLIFWIEDMDLFVVYDFEEHKY